MSPPAYVIRFDFPEGGPPFYAGMHKGAFGWAPTTATALVYEDPEIAERVLCNAYLVLAEHGRVVALEDEGGRA